MSPKQPQPLATRLADSLSPFPEQTGPYPEPRATLLAPISNLLATPWIGTFTQLDDSSPHALEEKDFALATKLARASLFVSMPTHNQGLESL